MTLFSLSGASRSGKTTLARRVAAKLSIGCHEVSVAKIGREAGFEMVSNMPLPVRLEAQEKLLEQFVVNIRKLDQPHILDRCPIDFIMYMLAEVNMHAGPPELMTRIHAYTERCIDVTKTYFDTVLALRPLPFYQVDPDKPPENPAYQWHGQYLIEGAINRLRPRVQTGFITITNFEDRVRAVSEMLEVRLVAIVDKRQSASLH